MKQFELRLENPLGNQFIATFDDVTILNKFIVDNPPQRKYHYYVVVEETTRTRYSDVSKVK